MMNSVQLHRIDLNLLALLEVLLTERHVGRAASRLHLTPSAVSHGLSRLRRLLHDPLFIRHPRGLNPTERAQALAVPLAGILDSVRTLVGSAEPFDPSRSQRQFVIAAVDAIGSVLLPDLMAAIRRAAPGVTLRVRAIFPQEVAETLDRRRADLVLAPRLDPPPRFEAHELFTEDFVIAARRGHPVLARPTIGNYCAASHLIVGQGDDAVGFLDEVQAARGLQRRVALTVPGFMWALAVLAETDLIAALPRSLLVRHGARAGVDFAEPPFRLRSDAIAAITVKAAMADAGLQWLLQRVIEAAPAGRPAARGQPRSPRKRPAVRTRGRASARSP